MGRSQETFGKKEKEKKRRKKREDKALKRTERKSNSVDGGLDTMMAYVDEFGNISETPPDPTKKKKEVKAENIELGVPKREAVDHSLGREGRVVFFNDSKGFGFIKELDSEEKFFVHVNGLLEEIKENDLVAFELERGMKGMNAVQVRIIAAPRPKVVESDEDDEDEEDDSKAEEATTDEATTEESKAEDKEDKAED